MYREITQSRPGDISIFANPGDCVEGKYLGVMEINRKDGTKAQVYSVDDNGVKKSFWGGYQINQTLPAISVGTKIKVLYKGEGKIKGGKTMKMFEIMVDDDAVDDRVEADAKPEFEPFPDLVG
jgi:hypothetical protein